MIRFVAENTDRGNALRPSGVKGCRTRAEKKCAAFDHRQGIEETVGIDEKMCRESQLLLYLEAEFTLAVGSASERCGVCRRFRPIATQNDLPVRLPSVEFPQDARPVRRGKRESGDVDGGGDKEERRTQVVLFDEMCGAQVFSRLQSQVKIQGAVCFVQLGIEVTNDLQRVFRFMPDQRQIFIMQSVLGESVRIGTPVLLRRPPRTDFLES